MNMLRGFLLLAALSSATAHAEPMPRIGMQLDVGLPGAAGATLVYRPRAWVRADGGLAYDYIGYGVRAGLKLAPHTGVVTPTIGVDAGHFFTGDATDLIKTDDPAKQELLRNAVYDFATAHIGFELGSQRRCSFYLRAGVSYVSSTARGDALSMLVNRHLEDTMFTAHVGDTHVHAVMPSASLGLNVYFK